MTNLHDLFALRLQGSVAAIAGLQSTDQLQRIITIAEALRDRLSGGGTIYTCGNGGSAAEALHLAEELIGRYRSNRPPLRALCLNADPTAMTCIANDFGFDQVFARPCRALLTERDALVVFSTSGMSENLAQVLQTAKTRKAVTVGLLGRDGGRCAAMCDHTVIIASEDSAHIQEAHQVALHLLCEAFET
jgi:D-sedoheptulose 7-phosphate isomerase